MSADQRTQHSNKKATSLRIIFAGMLTAIALAGAGVISYVLPLLLDRNLYQGFKTELLPSLESGMTELETKVEQLLGQKKQDTLTYAEENFTTNNTALVNSITAQLLPLAENNNLNGIVGVLENQLESSADINGFKVQIADSGEWLELGYVDLNDSARLFTSQQRNKFATVELEAVINTNRLQESIRLESESFNTLLTSIESLTEKTVKSTESKSLEIERKILNSARVQTVTAVVLFMLAFSSLVIVLLNKLVINPLASAVNLLQKIAGGDLTIQIYTRGNAEIASLLQAMKDMVEKIRNNVATVSQSTGDITQAANQMSTVTHETNAGIQKQQVEIDQVVAAVNQMAATAQEVARTAMDASDSTQSADKEAKNGQQVVVKTVDLIGKLSQEIESATNVILNLEKNTDSIGRILGVIKEIAEQTNLLALNAAIEAARAGEQGRGFAVVADEVRTLASRTQESTAEIENMIEQLQSGAKSAVRVMETSCGQAKVTVEQAIDAGKMLEKITGLVSVIATMNTQIANASEAQTTTTEEINRSLVNISQIVANTSDGAQKTAEAGGSLLGLAENLQNSVAQFKI